MAILESDYMDFGNGIIGDDTFDIWRKKTNSLKVEIDSVNVALTAKINTDTANLSTVYIPQAGSATSVSTALQFTSPITFASNVLIGDSTLSSSGNKLNIDKEVDSSVQLTSTKVRAKTNLILGDKTYNVPSSPAINNAVLVAQTNGTLSWQNVASIFQLSGGLNQTTAVFEEVMPVGSVIPLAANPNDPNFLLCEGALVGKSAYPDLYEVLKNGTATCIYGETTNEFRLPDYRGRVAVGTGGTSVTFPTSFGVTGGTDTRSTSGHTLTIDQIPAHRHWSPWVADDTALTSGQKTDYENSPLFGADAGNVTLTDRIHFDIGSVNATSNNDDYYAFTTYAGGASGDASLTGLTDVNNVQYTGGATTSHSHNITAANRVQPYITVKWYIKAKKNTKIDFKIDIANSGLKSTTFGGQAQTLISPVNETIQLDIDPDNTSIAIVNGKVAVKSSPTIPGSPIITGPDIKLYNETRRGTAEGSNRRALAHGNGNGVGDPELNGYDRKVVTTIRDSGVGENNDTLIINYNDISPNSVGDYTGGVIINGAKAIMFEDGTILNSAQRKGDAKKMMARQKGATGVTGRGLVAFIDDDDQPRINGYTSEYKAANTMSDHSYGWNNDYLPDEEEAEEVYLGYYHVSCVTKTGKIFGQGWSNIFGDVENTESNGQHAEWCRSFTSDNSVKFYDSSVTSIDTGIVNSPANDARSCYALDTNGLLWGTSDSWNTGQLARGGLTDISDEVSGSAEVLLSQKRDELASSIYNYSATSSNRLKVPHVMNPLATATGVLTTSPATATGFKVTFTKAIAVGGYAYNVIAAVGSDGLIYTAGYNGAGACGAGNTIDQLHWNIVKTATGTALNNVVEIYGRGYNPTLFAKTANGDIYGWGYNGAYELGDGTPTNRTTAIRIWDAAAKGASAKIYTSGSGAISGVHGGVSYIVTEHSQPQLWAAGSSNHYGPGQQGDIEDVVYTTWKRVTSGPWNTATHTVQDFYNCGGQATHANPNYCIALNNATAKLELWVTGYGGEGATGITYSGQGTTTFTDAGGYNGSTTKWERIRYINDRFLRKVVDIYPMHQNNSAWNATWHQHTIHLNDGRLFGVGRWPYGGLKDPYADDYFYKWQELNTLA